VSADLAVRADRAALLVVDVQERLWAVMPEADRARVERNLEILIELARRLRMPIVVSEQYPRGLGPTIGLVAKLVDAIDGVKRLEKMEFSCADAPGWEALAREIGRDQWVVVGQETHVCVYQTVRGLVAGGAKSVHVPADAVLSRTADNRQVGLQLIEKAGAVVTSTEVVVFDALVRAGTEDFKAMSKLVK
jgi:nicotinamidase-related amidase